MEAFLIIIKPRSTISFNGDKYTCKISNKVKILTSQFISLLQGKIAKIFLNKFQPINLYKFRHIKKCNIIY